MKNLILWIWQLPQNIAGIIMLVWNTKICKHKYEKITNADGITFYYVKHVNDCGISLGNYIFLDSDRSISQKSVKHEHGHQLQSLRLGWFYLLLIGIPSAIGNTYHRHFHKKLDVEKRNKWYYSQPWEKWADELGGVTR